MRHDKGCTKNGEALTGNSEQNETIRFKVKRNRLYGIFAIAILLYQPLVIFSGVSMAYFTVAMSIAVILYLGISLNFFRLKHKLLGIVFYVIFIVFVVCVIYYSVIFLTSSVDFVIRQITVYNLLIGFMLSLGEAFSKIYWMMPLENKKLTKTNSPNLYVNKLGVIFFLACYILYAVYCYLIVVNIYQKEFLLTAVVGWLIIVPILLIIQLTFRLSLCRSDKYNVIDKHNGKDGSKGDRSNFELL